MKERIPIFLGIFSVMALSNAIVPVLPLFAEGAAAQGFLYSAYFLGAFILTLPAGLLADRYGPVPVIRTGLFVTLISGLLLLGSSSGGILLAARVLEGFGAGLFVASALAWVNARPDHATESGIFLALLNGGLVTGLIVSGWVVEQVAMQSAGIVLFTALTIIPVGASLLMRNSHEPSATSPDKKSLAAGLIESLKADRWLWYSAVVLVGITGVVAALYPGFTGEHPTELGLQIAAMNIATIIGVLLLSRLSFPPVGTLRIAALAMALSVLALFVTPIGFIAIGLVAGVVMVAQLAYLAKTDRSQGTAMGLWSTATYAGMTVLPVIMGIVAELTTFLLAFILTAFFAVTVALTIGRCSCRLRKSSDSAADNPGTARGNRQR